MSVEAAMRLVQENGRVGRGKRYPEGLPAALASYARYRRAQGATWLDVECETGIGWMQVGGGHLSVSLSLRFALSVSLSLRFALSPFRSLSLSLSLPFALSPFRSLSFSLTAKTHFARPREWGATRKRKPRPCWLTAGPMSFLGSGWCGCGEAAKVPCIRGVFARRRVPGCGSRRPLLGGRESG